MAPVTFSELRDDRGRFDARFQDLPILTRNLIMNRYRDDPAYMKQSYRRGTDLASNTQSSPDICSWIYKTSAYDSITVQINTKELGGY